MCFDTKISLAEHAFRLHLGYYTMLVLYWRFEFLAGFVGHCTFTYSPKLDRIVLLATSVSNATTIRSVSD